MVAMDRRHRLLITLTLLLAACGGTRAAPTTPAPAATTGTPPVPTVPTVTEAALDPDTLTTFIRERFPAAVEAGRIELGYGSGGVGDELIEELAIMGITTTTQLAAIVPPDFDTRGFAAISPGDEPTIAGLVRDLLIIHDVRGYFTSAWRQRWVSTGRHDFPVPAAYGVDFAVMEELGVFGGDHDDPCAD